MITLSLPTVRAFGDDAAPLAPPVTVQSPPDSEATKHHEERSSTERRAADLRGQVSGLQSLVAQVKQQLAQRKAGKPRRANGQPASNDAQEQRAADLQRQDSELHSQLQSLIAQLGEELQLEIQSRPAPDVTEQQERQAARDALKHAIAELQQQDSQLQELIDGDEQALAPRASQVPLDASSIGEQQAARDPLESLGRRHTEADCRPAATG